MSTGDITWVSTFFKDEGDPVFVRHRLADAGGPRSGQDWLYVVTHHFTRVRPDGLPEADYNDTLFDLDRSLIRAMEADTGNLVVLVETCRGKRHYYAYVHDIDPVNRGLNRLINANREHTLSIRSALDPQRRFLARYLTLLPDETGCPS